MLHMASWSTKRKATYFVFFVIAIVLFIVLPLFLFFYKAPTCGDGIQNGSETGVDCGGKCAKICSVDYLSPNVLWSRSLVVAKGIYNAGAYVENPNLEGGASNVHYIFKLYDKDGLIQERSGITYLPPHKNVLVFEPSIKTGERIPTRTTFEFENPIDWVKMTQGEEFLNVASKMLSTKSKTPRLEATIENTSVKAVGQVDVVGIIYDINDNTIGFSKTNIDSIDARGTANVVFTWQLPFEKEAARIEVIPTMKH